MLDRALAQLAEIAGRDRRAAGAQGRLKETLHSLAEPVEPRAASALIHGELGPDHVLLDRRGSPAPATLSVNGSAAWPSITSSVHCSSRPNGLAAEARPARARPMNRRDALTTALVSLGRPPVP
jgi:hypothetical protein